MDSARTISQLKSTFLWGQVRIFSENLEPPENWRHHAAEAEEELTEKVIEDVLHKGAFVSHTFRIQRAIMCVLSMCTNLAIVNHAAKQHNRVVYSSQAIHHVAHQIASLYWASVNQDAQSKSLSSKGIDKYADLSRQMYSRLLTSPLIKSLILAETSADCHSI